MRPFILISGSFLLCSLLNGQTATTTTLAAVTPASPLFGQAVTLVAQVAPTAPGTVSFMDGGVLIGVGTLNGSGAAQVTTITLAAGQHSLRAIYGGGTGYSSSQSAAMPYTVTAGAASGFATPVNYAVTGFPGAIAVNDFNNDGKADVAVSTSGYLTVLLGNGDGTLQHKTDYPAIAPSSIAMGDFNADGKLDLAFTGYYNVLVMLGNGDGTFQTAVSYSLPGNSTSVAVGDVNRDGKADLIVAISGMQPCMGNVCTWIDGGIGVLLGNGGGTFGAVAKTTVAGSPAQVALSDFNGDGKIDIVAANLGGMISINSPRPGSGATVMLGNGDGTFQPAVTYPAGNGPDAIAIGDFNGDGKPDLAVVSGGDNAISILAGNGNGTFQTAAAYAVGSSSMCVVPADINADGKVDLVVPAGNTLAVLFGNGDGTFGGAVGYVAGDNPAYAAVADFNGDNRADLAVANPNGSKVSVSLGIFSSQGSALPTATGLAPSPNPSQYGQAVTLTAQVSPSDATGAVEFLDGVTVLGSAPLNASGIAQFSTTLLASGIRSLRAIYSGVSGAWKSSQSAVVSQVVNQPAASVGFPQMASYITGIWPYSVAAGDFNGDGKPDLAVANYGGQSVSVLPGNGDGTFGSAVTYALPGQANFVAVADFNGDGKQDLVVACPSYVSILLGNGDGTFQNPINRFVGVIAALITGDFNSDGKTDIALVDEQVSGAMKVMLGNGDGTLQAPTTYGAGSSPRSIASGDFNGDGRTDLVVANFQSNTFSVYLGNGDGTFRNQVSYPCGTYPAAVQAGDFNGDGKLDLAIGGSPLEVALGKGDGTFPSLITYSAVTSADAIAVADVNGDSKLDLAITRWTSGNGYSLAVMPGNGDGTFQTALNLADGFRSTGILAADFNGDGRTDLAAATYGGNILAVLLGTDAAAPQGASLCSYHALPHQRYSHLLPRPVGGRKHPRFHRPRRHLRSARDRAGLRTQRGGGPRRASRLPHHLAYRYVPAGRLDAEFVGWARQVQRRHRARRHPRLYQRFRQQRDRRRVGHQRLFCSRYRYDGPGLLSRHALPYRRHPQTHGGPGRTLDCRRAEPHFPRALRCLLQYPVDGAGLFTQLCSRAAGSAWVHYRVAHRAIPAGGRHPQCSDRSHHRQRRHRSGRQQRLHRYFRQQYHRSRHRYQRLLRAGLDWRPVVV